ncbi:MAG: DUF916 domain-containing protein, partial [Variovorax sp.]
MKRFKSIVLAAIAVLVGVALAVPGESVSAQSSAALSITPKKNYTIEPGKSANDKLTIRNLDGEKTLDLTLRVVDFTFTDDGGTPKLMLAEDAPQTTWSMKPFLTVPKTVKIAPNSSKSIDMKVTIPKNQGAGSFYSAVVYSSGTAEGGNVGLNASGVTLVFTNIPGEVKENLKLEKFGAYVPAAAGKKAGYTFITMKEPENIAYTLKNEGNVTAAPAGSITVKSMFGKEYQITDVNPNASLALIGQTRTFTSCIKIKSQDVDFNGARSQAKTCTSPGLWPGYYSASLNMLYGQNGNNTKDLSGSASFWYLPAWFLVVLLIVIVAIALGIWRLVVVIRGGSRGNK